MPISIAALPKQLRVMFVGDSICVGGTGADTTAYGGWRLTVTKTMISRLSSGVRFVGGNAPANNGLMCGTSGLTVSEVDATPYLTDQLAQYKPDVILLHIGTNDCTQLNSGGSPTLATTRANLTTLLDRVRSTLPGCVVFICRIIDNNTAHTQVVNFNTSAIDTDVAARSDYTSGLVKIVDMYTAVGLYSATNYVDGSHPNGTGYALMAAKWQSDFNLYY